MSHPHRPWNEQFEDDDRRRRRREEEQRSDFRERDPQRAGRFGREEDDDFDSPGRFGERERGDADRGRRGGYFEQQRSAGESGFGRGREREREGWESYEEWQQPRRLAGYYEGHRFGGGQQGGAGRYSERERWQPYAGGAQDFERGFQDWQRRGESSGQRFGQGGYGQSYGEGYSQGFGESQRFGSESGLGRFDQDRGFAGRGPKNYKRSDQRIQEDVCERLTSDPRIDATEIQVEVKSGEVTLEGSVSEREMKRRAEDCAEYVSGVNQVHNRLRVSGQSQQGQTGQGQSGQGQSGSESWGRVASEQRGDQSGTTPGRSGRTT